jgi:hypothetical protein
MYTIYSTNKRVSRLRVDLPDTVGSAGPLLDTQAFDNTVAGVEDDLVALLQAVHDFGDNAAPTAFRSVALPPSTAKTAHSSEARNRLPVGTWRTSCPSQSTISSSTRNPSASPRRSSGGLTRSS